MPEQGTADVPDESRDHNEQPRPGSSETNQQSNSALTRPISNESAPTSSNDSTTSSSSTSWRQTLGRPMVSLSNVINENIVVARYGFVASVALLSAYGIAHTPLLYRFRSVKDIPSVYFTSRRKIHCRLVRVLDDNKSAVDLGDAERPVVCLVRHMSPLGRLLPRSLFDSLIQSSPSGSGRKLGDNVNELLKVELAGIRQAPFYRSLAEQPGEWLQLLADQHPRVSCELISRCAAKQSSTSGSNLAKRRTRTLKEFEPISNDQTAVCRLRYRPGKSFFRVDLGQSLVRYGRATISSAGMHVPDESVTVVDTSESLKDLEEDTKYMQKLEQAEYLAAKGSHGMFSDAQVRSDRKDIVEEIEFEAKATVIQKLWRWLRGA